MSSASGSTTTISSATRTKPTSSSERGLMRIPNIGLSPSDLQDKQSLWADHEQRDDDEKRQHLCHRPGQKKFERRLRLRDCERRGDRAQETLGAAEHND